MRARELLRRLDDTEVDTTTSVSLAAAIAEQVRAGAIPAGVELPSERDLAAALGRSRGTIARAYEALRGEGLAHTRHGAGTTIGCCAGPWASTRAAELATILPVAAPETKAWVDRTVDLRSLRWSSSVGGGPTPGTDPLPEGSLVVEGRVRALDVVLSTLLRPGERVLVPALADPALLALLRIRGLHPVRLPTDADARADVPAWLHRLRTRAAPVAVLAPSHAAPAGATLAAHDRRLLVEAAADGEVTVVEDRSWDDLWLDTPPPADLAALDADERTVCLRTVQRLAPADELPHASDGVGSDLTWIATASGAVQARLAAVARTLEATPAGPTPPAGAPAGVAAARRQHLVDHTALTIRLVTPVAPRVQVAPATGGPLRLLHLGAVPGSVVTDALAARGVLVHAGLDCVVGGGDVPAIAVSLTGTTSVLVAGLRAVVEVATELA